jgi:hypothetical protein
MEAGVGRVVPVGSRVEVLWEGAVYAAKVVHCHSTGECDVVCELGREAGMRLTREEHRLLPLPKCFSAGCTCRQAVRGACLIHGEHGICRVGDCTTSAVNAQGTCGKHVNHKACNVPDCGSSPIKGGRCFKHGGHGACTVSGCTTTAKLRGLCYMHGGDTRPVCTHPRCTTKAQTRGLCGKHGGASHARTFVPCKHSDCTSRSRGKSGLCAHHGGCTRIACAHAGCTTKALSRGVCCKHGGDTRPACKHPACTTRAFEGGLCCKHGGKKQPRPPCMHPGCTTKAITRGLCFKHGGGTRTVCTKEGSTQAAPDDVVFAIRSIHGHRRNRKGKLEYHISWLGHADPKSDTWEPEESLTENGTVENFFVNKYRKAKHL